VLYVCKRIARFCNVVNSGGQNLRAFGQLGLSLAAVAPGLPKLPSYALAM
jgi:hypothetical protein